MRKEHKTLGKRIAASALAIATAFVLIPFGGKEANASTTLNGVVQGYGLDGDNITLTENASFVTDNADVKSFDVYMDAGPWLAEEAGIELENGDYFIEYMTTMYTTDDPSTATFNDYCYASGTLILPILDGYVGTDAVLEDTSSEYFTLESTSESTITLSISQDYSEAVSSESTDTYALRTIYVRVHAEGYTPELEEYTVTFETNGGSKVDAQKVEDGSTADKPTDPTKDGYTFEGWYSNDKLTEKYDFSSAITGDITLYAKWTEDTTEASTSEPTTTEPTTTEPTTTEPTTAETTTTEAATESDIKDDTPSTNAMSADLGNSTTELKTLVLTDEDIAALEAGEEVSVWLTVDDIASTVDAADKAKVEEATKAASSDYSIGSYLDISLFKKVGDTTSSVKTTNGKIKITFALPESLQGDYTYKIVRLHDGVPTVLDAAYDAATKTLTFETDQFSTYAIIYKAAAKTEAATTTEATTASKSSPKTGDSALPYAVFALLGLSALAGAYSLKKLIK